MWYIKSSQGGGVALILRSDIRVKALPTPGLAFKTFELLLSKLVNSVSSMTVAIIYRPPTTNVSALIAELSDLIDSGVLGSMGDAEKARKENARMENDGQKSRGGKWRKWKTMDKKAGVENDGKGK